MSATSTRIDVRQQLEQDIPDVQWKDGRLPETFVHKTEIVGAVYTGREEQAANDQYIARTLMVQAFLPATPTTNTTKIVLRDQTEIEELAQSIINSVLGISVGNDDYWYIRPMRVDYMPDPNLQPTRCEVTFVSYDGSVWM